MYVRKHVDNIIFAINKGFSGLGKGSNVYLDRRRHCGGGLSRLKDVYMHFYS